MTVPLSLPPPTVFTHKETLHRIELPALAKFLHSLSEPAHLVRLHDILDQYRTPQSYHRVDIREINSSELPPDNSADQGETSKPPPQSVTDSQEVLDVDKQLDDGEPIELDHGVTLEQHRAAGSEGRGEGPSLQEEIMTVDEQETLAAQTAAGQSNGGEPEPGTVQPDESDTPSHQNQAVKVAENGRAASPEATHPLPPSGPKRRVRELRLDLRTLDASALFALENWRRDVSGLDKLPYAHPDSIWYKSPTPEPSPPPPAPPIEDPPASAASATLSTEAPAKRLVGRPRKHPRISQSPRTSTTSPRAASTQRPNRASVRRSTASASAQPEIIDATLPMDEGGPSTGAVDEAVQDDLIAISEHDVEQGDQLPDEITEIAVSANLAAVMTASQSADIAVELEVHEETIQRDVSPDQILVDDYKMAEDDDSDFEPEVWPPRRPVAAPGRPRKSVNAEASGSAPRPRPAFARVPSPQPMMETFYANMQSKTGPRAFAALPEPAPMLGSRARGRPRPRASAPNEPIEMPPAPSPIRRVSLSVSPSKRSVSPQKRSSVGYDSNTPIMIPDSPVASARHPLPAPTMLPVRESAFMPFVREPMRMPSYVNHGTDAGQPSYPNESNSGQGSHRGKGRLSNSGRAHETTKPRQEAKRKTQVVEEDEWSEFRF